jgi:hypothetical protein
MPPRSKTAILWESILSFLALPPWMAFIASAWPSERDAFGRADIG